VYDSRRAAAEAGIAVELADLGAWAGRLISEYDAPARTIRVNERALAAYRRACGELDSCAVRAFIDLAVAHELYHHREAAGEVERFATRAGREAAADAFARSRVPVDARLAAFLDREAAS
jgi:hypothetical protein